MAKNKDLIKNLEFLRDNLSKKFILKSNTRKQVNSYNGNSHSWVEFFVVY